MKTRTDLLNHLAERYRLKRYLEIGVQNSSQNFDKINCEYKIGVDPDPKANAAFCMTSDEFFAMAIAGGTQFDLVFIDGMHTAEQVRIDFHNAIQVISDNGFIVLHDCNPQKEEHTIVPRPTKSGHWNGSVYKFACELGMYYKKFKVVAIDNGCGVWSNGGADILKDTNYPFPIEWNYFDQWRGELLNLTSWDEFFRTL